MKLPIEIKTKWIAALRSGDYKQGREKLKADVGSETRYCCLGVLAEVCGMQWHETDGVYGLSTGHVNDYTVAWLHGAKGLPADVRTVLDEKLSSGKTVESTLVNLNDTQEYDFNYIASWIEENL